MSIVVNMTEPVLEGDKDRLEAAVQSVDWDINWQEKFLRMNSHGGSLSASIELAEYIYATGFQTYVGKNDSCLSACAIAFMHEAQLDGDDTRNISRVIRHDAVIGFHAAYAFPKIKNSQQRARRTFALG
ncbi:hypothetical protein [uncultured Sulfitobacter sp.]|uniref:hypothetical protein n=1 Tax=uncultured Sulfitobacter sp. TaxID=191468 RepID=UPI0026025DD0|nr:hypothetical protein [uncultured Sulfitobacter sp.]